MALDAAKFAGGGKAPLGFGIDRGSVARELRDLADRIEAGVVVVSSVRVLGLSPCNEFNHTLLRLKLHESRRP